jgi:hypothetical protein
LVFLAKKCMDQRQQGKEVPHTSRTDNTPRVQTEAPQTDGSEKNPLCNGFLQRLLAAFDTWTTPQTEGLESKPMQRLSNRISRALSSEKLGETTSRTSFCEDVLMDSFQDNRSSPNEMPMPGRMPPPHEAAAKLQGACRGLKARNHRRATTSAAQSLQRVQRGNRARGGIRQQRAAAAETANDANPKQQTEAAPAEAEGFTARTVRRMATSLTSFLGGGEEEAKQEASSPEADQRASTMHAAEQSEGEVRGDLLC